MPSGTTSISKARMTCVAFLRGINVGGKNKLSMKDFSAILTEEGCHEVQTYIQSGNAVFTTTPSIATRLALQIQRRIARLFGLNVPVVLRTAEALQKAAQKNPFLKDGRDADSMHVAFLANRPTVAQVKNLDMNRSPGDSFKVRDAEVFLYLPHGVARTKLTNAYFDSILKTTSTMRNWRTVLKLIEIAQSKDKAST